MLEAPVQSDDAGIDSRDAAFVLVEMIEALSAARTIEDVADILMRHRGEKRVRLDLEVRDLPKAMRVRLELQAVQVRPSEQLVADLERVCGPGAIKLR